MNSTSFGRLRTATLVVCLACWSGPIWSQEARTVIGPRNPELAEGAEALLAGDAKEGVRLTLLGLKRPASAKDRKTGLSNLCAGYALLKEYETGLGYCDQVIELDDNYWRAYSNRALIYVKLKRFDEAEADLQHAESLAPNSRTIRAVRAMLLDAIEPVAPNVVIDDRRQPPQDLNSD